MNQSTNVEIPAWAIVLTDARSLAGKALNQGSVDSILEVAAVVNSPVIRETRRDKTARSAAIRSGEVCDWLGLFIWKRS
jgi:hypothetical protein